MRPGSAPGFTTKWTGWRFARGRGRPAGRRVKHGLKQNWIKLYDKAGLVLRVETVINQPEECRVRRRVRRRGRRKTEWVRLRQAQDPLVSPQRQPENPERR